MLGSSCDNATGSSKQGQLRAEREGHTPVICIHDSLSKSIFATGVPRKGSDPRVVKWVVSALDWLGYRRIVL